MNYDNTHHFPWLPTFLERLGFEAQDSQSLELEAVHSDSDEGTVVVRWWHDGKVTLKQHGPHRSDPRTVYYGKLQSQAALVELFGLVGWQVAAPPASPLLGGGDADLLPEDPQERKQFDIMASRLGGPLQAVAFALHGWHTYNPKQGSLSQVQSIMHNEIQKALAASQPLQPLGVPTIDWQKIERVLDDARGELTYDGGAGYNHGLVYEYDEAVKEILTLSAASPSTIGGSGGWISVAERLPEIDGIWSDYVLVALQNGTRAIAHLLSDNDWFFPALGKREPANNKITHWQHLPASPTTTQKGATDEA